MAHWRLSATKRLLHDFKQVLEHPLANVAAHPLENDLFVWHGNVRGADDTAFTDVPFHFVLVFPEDYPSGYPTVGLFTRLPHPNITRWIAPNARTKWRLAIWDCNPAENRWCCAYTVHSILVQLQAFLISEDLMWTSNPSLGLQNQISLPAAIQEARQMARLKDCPHSGAEPWPRLPTELELEASSKRQNEKKLRVAAPRPKRQKGISPLSSPLSDRPSLSTRPGLASKSPACLEDPLSMADRLCPEAEPKVKPEDDWQVVKTKKRAHNFASNPASPPPEPKSSLRKVTLSKLNPYAKLTMSAQRLLDKQNKISALKKAEAAEAAMPTVAMVKANPKLSTASSKKNAKRAEKRAEKRSAGLASTSLAVSLSQSTKPAPPTSHALLPTAPAPGLDLHNPAAASAEDWTEVPQKIQKHSGAYPDGMTSETPHASLIASVFEAIDQQEETDLPGPELSPRDEAMGLKMGLFTQMPPDVMVTLLTLLERKDMRSLACTCKALKATCDDGELWRLLMKRDFSGASITAARTSDWKHAYQLQTSNIAGELQCYFTKVSFEDEVLGMPVYHTTNPRTKVLDYIQASPSLLSLSAFRQGVRSSLNAEELGGAMLSIVPVYLTEDHFKRAIPALPALLKALNPNVPSHQLKPAMWLDACAKMLNTAVVLLIDNGVKASQKAINAYSLIHRLLLALAEQYNLWAEAGRRLDNFLKAPANRHKEKCPNVGWLIAMLVVSPKHTWADLSVPVLLEAFDRSVLWACKANSNLVQRFQVPDTAGGEDKELLDGVFVSMRIGRGLIAFHSAFMRFVARPPRAGIEQVMNQADSLYGFASEAQIEHIQQVIKDCQAMSSWAQFLKLIGATPQTGGLTLDAFMTRLLRRSWHNSLKKKYHAKGMDFSKVQRSGVSTILLKGQRYTASPTIQRMEVTDIWRARNAGIYFDSSFLVFHWDGHLICTVDYLQHASHGTQQIGAVTHLGDITDYTYDGPGIKMKQKGTINFSMLGKHVKEIYLTATAWSSNTLADIMQPHLVMTDPATGMKLCEYHLEERSKAELRDKKCVVMCRVHRESVEGNWRVEAIGDILQRGHAGNYGPITDYIAGRRSP